MDDKLGSSCFRIFQNLRFESAARNMTNGRIKCQVCGGRIRVPSMGPQGPMLGMFRLQMDAEPQAEGFYHAMTYLWR
jgi:hypothetical protein